MAMAASTRKPPKASRPAPRADLSRARILDAAQALIDREGDAALTFRRLGAELGADPTAAYRPFRNKDAPLRALGARLLGEALDPAVTTTPAGAGWRTVLRVHA